MFRRSGVYVGRILGGIKPVDLPIERPARFELGTSREVWLHLSPNGPRTPTGFNREAGFFMGVRTMSDLFMHRAKRGPDFLR